VADYKKIADLFARIEINGDAYWDMGVHDKKKEGLPHSFPQDH